MHLKVFIFCLLFGVYIGVNLSIILLFFNIEFALPASKGLFWFWPSYLSCSLVTASQIDQSPWLSCSWPQFRGIDLFTLISVLLLAEFVQVPVPFTIVCCFPPLVLLWYVDVVFSSVDFGNIPSVFPHLCSFAFGPPKEIVFPLKMGGGSKSH